VARYSRVGAGPRIVGLIFLILFLAAGGALWFDYLGIIDATSVFAPALRLVGIEARQTEPQLESPLLLESERIAKREAALNLLQDELRRLESDLESREAEVLRREEELAEWERELVQRENSLSDTLRGVENRRAVLERISQDLTSMPPDDAVAILSEYDDQLLIDTLRVTEQLAQQAGELSLVSVWLSRLPADRAAEVQRKMTLKPTES
jgi:flagellar protein FlbB